MCGTETNRRRECVGNTRGLLLPGCCSTGSVSAHSAISAAHQSACKPHVTKSRALIRSFHGEVCLDPDAVLAALANPKSHDKAAVRREPRKGKQLSIAAVATQLNAEGHRNRAGRERSPQNGASRPSESLTSRTRFQGQNFGFGYRSRAVRALVLLHDEHVRRFLVVWNQAQAASVVLPKTDDPAYASLETLLRHVLGRRPRLHDVDVRGTRVTRSRDPHTAGADGPARARGHASDSSCVPARRADAPALNRRGSAG